MPERAIRPSPRKEEIRDKKDIIPVAVQFELSQIKEHFYRSLDDIKKQYPVAESLLSDGKEAEAMDIWRFQVVFVEGILDFFIHEISKYAIIRMFKGEWEKSESYNNFMVPMSTVEEGLKTPESTEWLFSRLNNRFSLEVYLSGNALGSQLSLIGMNYGEICKLAFPELTTKSGKAKMKALYSRRNQIAHQADRKHCNAEKEPIDRAFVEDAINTVVSFVEAVYSTALGKQSF